MKPHRWSEDMTNALVLCCRECRLPFFHIPHPPSVAA